jgi:hypothetical protein
MQYHKTLIVLLLIVRVSVFSQEVFAPFVSRIKIEVNNNLLRLSWIDSPDARGPVYIYRSQSPFDTRRPLPDRPRPVEVPYGAQSYVDEVEGLGPYYYFIVASMVAGNRYPILIPYSNEMAVSLASDQQVLSHELNIFSLEAVPLSAGVAVSYRTTASKKDIILYRSTHAIAQKSDLVQARIVRLHAPTSFVDYPVPGISYYYAVVFADDLIADTIDIVPGYNATMEPVVVMEYDQSAVARRVRDMPIPRMMVSAAVPGLQTMSVTTVALTPEAAQALDAIALPARSSPPVYPLPQVLGPELNRPTNNEEYMLYSMVQDVFVDRQWEQVKNACTVFLALPRSTEFEMRTHFYRGQADFFLGLLPDALFEFLSIRSFYPAESYQWIAAVLTAMIDR